MRARPDNDDTRGASPSRNAGVKRTALLAAALALLVYGLFLLMGVLGQ